MDIARWGLIPRWFRKTLKEWSATSFNARVETVETSASFRDAYRNGRAVQPAAGFYEWSKREGKTTPYYIHPADNAPVLSFAALWTEVDLPDFKGLTCAILTEPASAKFVNIHDRQPVMLDREGMAAWLAGVPLDQVPRIDMSKVDWHEVSAAVGNVRNDGPDVTKPV
jgi:putative SOS response-associated peptidase YedK